MTQALTKTGRRERRPLTAERKAVFISELRRHGVVAEAARVASPHSQDRHGCKSTFLDEARRDPAFAAELAEAQAEADSKLLLEARRRAVHGVERGIFQKGTQATTADGKPATQTEYSDRLLELLLKSRFPNDFIERRAVEHSQAPSGWVITASDLHCLNDEETEWLQRIMGRVMQSRGEIVGDPALDYSDAVDADFLEIEEGEPERPEISDEELAEAVPW